MIVKKRRQMLFEEDFVQLECMIKRLGGLVSEGYSQIQENVRVWNVVVSMGCGMGVLDLGVYQGGFKRVSGQGVC